MNNILINKFLRIVNTVKYLKYSQLIYQIIHKLRANIRQQSDFNYMRCLASKSYPLDISLSFLSKELYSNNSFTFLNQSHYFEGNIDWNYSKFGNLWTYNLTYFDYLLQEGMGIGLGKALINSFIDQMEIVEDGLEPYPISIRGINWVKFLTQYKIKDQKIDNALITQYYILMDNIEYHLLGNHLLENGFSLLFGAFYFQDEKLYAKANKILKAELKEQILNDGGHFELSPMYHQLILFRVLDSISLVKRNDFKNQELLVFLECKANKMLAWLNRMTFKNGNIPLFNDSANDVAPTTQQLNAYATRLNLELILNTEEYQLDDSGYRKHVDNRYELVMDVGNIGPDYIPGHAHADTFNFELYIDGHAFIVDTGISTYEKNEVRQFERSTESHNTVTVNNENQSEVWGGFRVGKRAKIIDIMENKKEIVASHDGYKKIDSIHKRSFKSSELEIEIKDTLIGKNNVGKAYFHFHPSIKNITLKDKLISFVDLGFFIKFRSEDMKIERRSFNYASTFNITQKATLIVVTFKRELITNILLVA